LDDVQGASVIDVDGHGCDLEDIVVESHEGVIGPDAKTAVFWQAIAADARPGKD
jgi:hypothetical protein